MNQYSDEEKQNMRPVLKLPNLEFLWDIEEMVLDITR